MSQPPQPSTLSIHVQWVVQFLCQNKLAKFCLSSWSVSDLLPYQALHSPPSQIIQLQL